MNEKLIEKYRHINVDFDDWHTCVITNFIDDMKLKGIEIEYNNVYYSGFYSQGDGASFTCRFNPVLFLEAHGLAEQYPAAHYIAKSDMLLIESSRTNSRYSHENTVTFLVIDEGYRDYEYEGDTDDLRTAVELAMAEKFENEECHRITVDVTEICRGYMQDLYRALSNEYDHLTSDEVVWEAIVANEMDKDEEETMT